jgi:TRAP-type mannitol/chloroaromatic compound transport system permease small subunit
LRLLERVTDATVEAASMLALPLSLLLFLQWPLREWLHAYSREVNDAAQILFAFYVSVAITAATRAHVHLAAADGARQGSRVERAAALAVLVPWSTFVLYASWGSVVQSVRQLESFPETYNPGYFLIRIALVVLTLLTLAQAIVTALRPAKLPVGNP